MASIQETTRRVEEMHQTLLTMLASHDERLDDHASQMASIRGINEALAELSRDIAGMLVSQEGRLASIQEDAQRTRDLLAEAREDNRMTRNLWVRLARRYGWLDDEDLQG